MAALALLPAAGEAIYFRDKISWRSAIAPSEMVTVDQAREWGDTAIWVDARPDDEFANEHVPGAISLNEDRWNELLPQFLAVWVQQSVPHRVDAEQPKRLFRLGPLGPFLVNHPSGFGVTAVAAHGPSHFPSIWPRNGFHAS